jgi:hypothetical protein
LQTVQFRDRAGQSVRLTPIRYEFPDASPSSDWDADWLVIEGEIVSASGTWRFQNPALSARECAGLGAWLTQVTKAAVPVTDPDEYPSLTFLEPSLAFSVASYEDQCVRLRVHLSHLAAPPWQDIDDKLNTWAFFVELDLDRSELARAREEWSNEADAFPRRST